MARIIKKLIALFVCTAFDIRSFIPDLFNVHVFRRHERIVRDTSQSGIDVKQAKRIAIVAIYPSAHSLPFTCNLLDGLNANGFTVVTVSTKKINEPDRAALLSRCARLIERLPAGRDFGSYRLGLKSIGLCDGAQDFACEQLILANDSMYYRGDIGDLIAEMRSTDKQCLGMFENYERCYHAQSFFLVFDRAVFASEKFREFWRRYSPYSTRQHAINKGELGLSGALREAGFSMGAYFNSTRIRSMLERVELTDAKGDLLDLLSDRAHFEFNMMFDGVRALATQEGRSSGATFLRDLFWFRTVRGLCHVAETSNPTHPLGLLLNRFGKAPVKRDVCYRGTFDIAQVVASVSGLNQVERVALEADLRTKGLPVFAGTVRRILFQNGRI